MAHIIRVTAYQSVERQSLHWWWTAQHIVYTSWDYGDACILSDDCSPDFVEARLGERKR